MRPLYIIILFLLILFSCSSKESHRSETRGFNEERLSELNTSARFDYDRVIAPYENPVLIFFAQMLSWIASLFQSYIGFVVIAIFIAVIIYIIAVNADHLFPARTSGSEDNIIEVKEEHIEAIDYDPLLKKALEVGDFRLAIRYSFLRVLKMLQQTGLIDWHKEKTNYQYLFELPEQHRPGFKRIISYFEYTWYGQFEATEAIYGKIDQQIKDLRDKIR